LIDVIFLFQHGLFEGDNAATQFKLPHDLTREHLQRMKLMFRDFTRFGIEHADRPQGLTVACD
jgi:hypothetical protein